MKEIQGIDGGFIFNGSDTWISNALKLCGVCSIVNLLDLASTLFLFSGPLQILWPSPRFRSGESESYGLLFLQYISLIHDWRIGKIWRQPR